MIYVRNAPFYFSNMDDGYAGAAAGTNQPGGAGGGGGGGDGVPRRFPGRRGPACQSNVAPLS